MVAPDDNAALAALLRRDALGTALLPFAAAAAATFGFKVVWVNRFSQPQERLPGDLVTQIDSLSALPDLIGV